jgi:hypothetical protein
MTKRRDSNPSLNLQHIGTGNDRIPILVLLAIPGLLFLAWLVLLIAFLYRPEMFNSSLQRNISLFAFETLTASWPSALLFGALKSKGAVSGKIYGISYRFGGSASLFVLLFLISLRWHPAMSDTFDLSVRVYGVDDSLLKSGDITLDLGSLGLRKESIGLDGETYFRGLPDRIRGREISVICNIEGYDDRAMLGTPIDQVLALHLHKSIKYVILTGDILPIPLSAKRPRITVVGNEGDAFPDDKGRFMLRVAGKVGDRVRVRVFEGPRLIYDDFQILPGPITLTSLEPDLRPER